MRKVLASAALSLAVCGTASLAQDVGNRPADRTAVPATTEMNRRVDENYGFNPGWLGLVGLIGLAGLMPRDRRDRHVDTHAGKTTVSR